MAFLRLAYMAIGGDSLVPPRVVIQRSAGATKPAPAHEGIVIRSRNATESSPPEHALRIFNAVQNEENEEVE